ncbi:MAG: hypothetical protein QM791_12940 [Ferruginibacter sp.]
MANFGKRIELSEVTVMYQAAIEIRNRSYEKIKEALKDDEEAQRYYLERETIFFFNRDLVDHMLEILGKDTGDTKKGVAIYPGSKQDSATGKNGRPTLMVVPYNTVIKDGKEKITVVDVEGDIIVSEEGKEGLHAEKTTADGSKSLLAAGASLSAQQHPGNTPPPPPPPPPTLKSMSQQFLPTSFSLDEIQTGD